MNLLSIKDLNSFNEDHDIKYNEEKLVALGGVKSLEKSLGTNFETGIRGGPAVFEERRQLYGKNEFAEVISQSWFEMFIESFEDATLLVLIGSAVVSLAVGIYEDPSKGWIEGGAILLAVLVVAVVTATNNYNKEVQFRKLNAQKDDVSVSVIRNGVDTVINVKELVVGDIVRLNAGDKVPADGILVEGTDVSCNESALTGESDEKRKNTKLVSEGGDMFMLSGATLISGYCHVLVIAVGENSRWGKTRAKLAVETEETPLQEKLDVLAAQIGNIGMAAAGATFIALLAIWYLYPTTHPEGITLFTYVLKAFIMGVTIVVVAVPEGLPLAVTLSLAYSTQKMMHDNNLIRVLAACETMGNATNICSDKTGTLTQNRMTVVEAYIGKTSYALNKLPDSKLLNKSAIQFLSENIALNSTATLMINNGVTEVHGSSTEGALLLYLQNHLLLDYVKLRHDVYDTKKGDRMFTFSSARKCMSTLICQKNDPSTGVVYTKGAAEVILSRCTYFMNEKGDPQKMTTTIRHQFEKAIQSMAKKALRTVVLAHREVIEINGKEPASELESSDFILDIIVGIKDPLRPDVVEAVNICQQAGIFVRMVTGDNIDTAKAIAAECGIYTEGGLAMEGPEFRKLSPSQLDAILPQLQVLARSSPTDKHTLVCRLNGHQLPTTKEEWEELHPGQDYDNMKDILLPGYADEWAETRRDHGGEVVGVTGDGTNDGPALKAADVGLSMGLSGTDVAKEASDIVILDDNFSSIVKAVMWGRSVFDNIRKFLQFQLTVNVVALTLTFLSAVTAHTPPLNAVMMLWVNMIMDTMGALALGTEPPSLNLLDRRPYRRNASLISYKMLRNITVQSLFQLGLLVYLLLLGYKDFDVILDSREHYTIIFNSFVFCQVFNEINARSIGDELNVFKGLSKNGLFISILIFTVFVQFFIVQYGGDLVRTSPLSTEQWLKCILLGSLSLPLGGLMRLIPVQDSLSDFAETSTLIDKHLSQNVSKKSIQMHNIRTQSVWTFSFYIWVLAVTVIPAVTVMIFKDDVMSHIQDFL